ncbi:MAG TPA: chromate transporter [Beijerinckiaceae bacterium]|jgi:chromate transporter
MRDDNLLTLVIVLAPLSIAAIGGATGIYAPLQHATVEVRHWLTPREFLDLFAIARVTPGPSSMLVTLIGWKIAGLAGALVATLALYVPSSMLCYAVAHIWDKHRGKAWHGALERGLAPVGAGLVFAGLMAILRLNDAGPLAWVIVGGVAGLLTWRPKLHPFLLLLGGAGLFVAAEWF